ncbi:MAG: LPS export ABC transporter periplasmic protein LptC [Gammaproteobacteria bacterium]|nr:LPS export ABC transporter periplasmic protein LptC [Gammaproteobacteria bacterium]
MNTRLLFAIIGLLAIVGFSGWLLYQEEVIHPSEERSEQDSPDYSISTFTITEHDDQGLPLYDIQGEEMIHYPKSDRLTISRPLFRSYQHQTVLWQAESESAQIDNQSRVVTMQGKTTLHYFQRSDQPPTIIHSSDMIIEPDEKIAQSQAPTRIETVDGHINAAQGFVLDGEKKRLSMSGGVTSEIRHD